MIEKNMHLPGRGRLASVMCSLTMILILISASVIMLGCEQVSSDTAMQCYGCIQALQKAISSALQAAEQKKTEMMRSPNSGGIQPLQSSIEDLTLLQHTLDYLMAMQPVQSSSQWKSDKNIGISSIPLLDEAKRALLKQYNSGYMTEHYAGEGQ